MIRPDRYTFDYLIARPIRFSWLLLPLMGFECVMSEHPLASFEDGFVDPALVGHWIETGEGSDDSELFISMRDDGMMAVDFVLADEDERPFYRYRGYASRLGEDTYANLEFVDLDCQACIETDLAGQRTEFFEGFAPIVADSETATCTFIVIRYEHTADDRLILNWQRSSGVRRAIAEQRLAGRIFAESDAELEGEPCITAPSADFAAWLAAAPQAMFDPSDVGEYIRQE